MPAAPDATADQIRDVNTRYHDLAAGSYDAKWGIDFGSIGVDQVTSKVRKALGREPEGWGDALEIGAGTGYFSLNLMSAGLIERLTATDISPGMLETFVGNAEQIGLGDRVGTAVTDAEQLPFDDESFDLVLGHAVLHHIPDMQQAAAELFRVLRPGGTAVFCGEPSANGDRLAAIPKRGAGMVAPLWRRAMGADARQENGNGSDPDFGHELEPEVDVHAFDPALLSSFFRQAGFADTRVKGEELLSNMYGWVLRTVESTAEPEQVPYRWRRFAFDSYIALQRLDNAVLEPYLPPEIFYNLVLSARKPG